MVVEFKEDNGNGEPNVRNIVREGVICNVYPDRNAVRVVFPDADNLVSGELQILTPYAGNTKFYHLPDIGEVVVVLMTGNDEESGTGYVIGSTFHAKNLPNSDNADEMRIDFPDGTSISYDRANHKLNINSAGDITINAKGNIKMTARRIDLN